jgi:ParB family transcriptional regulator, chromosome partitioning protein
MSAVDKPRALGRGLNALFGDDETAPAVLGSSPAPDTNPSGRKLIPISQITPGALQPRHTFIDDTINELAASIKQHGLLQPILVRPLVGEDAQYEIVAGERRWRAAQKAQLHEVPVIIRELNDDETLEIALIENLQREDLNPIDEAFALQQLLDQFCTTHDEVAAKVGKSRPYVANMLRLTELPQDIADAVRGRLISAGHARALLPLSHDKQVEMVKLIVEKGLSVRHTEKLAAEAKGTPIKHRMKELGKAVNKAAGHNDKDVNTLALEREVSNVLGMHVVIDMASAQEGVMSIQFKTLDQLDDVLHRLSHNPGRLGNLRN